LILAEERAQLKREKFATRMQKRIEGGMPAREKKEKRLKKKKEVAESYNRPKQRKSKGVPSSWSAKQKRRESDLRRGKKALDQSVRRNEKRRRTRNNSKFRKKNGEKSP